MDECNAPDCDNTDFRWPRRYCSNVCMNVGIQVAAETLAQDDITKNLPDGRVEEIREGSERAHKRIMDKLESSED